MKPKRWRALKPGMSRSTAFAAASRRSLERGSAATAFGACDGGGWQRPVCRSASSQSSTTSSAVPGFSPRPDDTAKGSGRSSNIAAYFSGPPIAGKADKITENDDPRTGPTNAFSRPIKIVRDSRIDLVLIHASGRRRGLACMARSLSVDPRRRVVGAIEGGLSCRAAAQRFDVSASRCRHCALQSSTDKSHRYPSNSEDRRCAPRRPGRSWQCGSPSTSCGHLRSRGWQGS